MAWKRGWAPLPRVGHLSRGTFTFTLPERPWNNNWLLVMGLSYKVLNGLDPRYLKDRISLYEPAQVLSSGEPSSSSCHLHRCIWWGHRWRPSLMLFTDSGTPSHRRLDWSPLCCPSTSGQRPFSSGKPFLEWLAVWMRSLNGLLSLTALSVFWCCWCFFVWCLFNPFVLVYSLLLALNTVF